MIIDTERVKETLFNKNISVRQLAKDTGVGASTISQLRLGRKQFKNLREETLEKVQAYIDEVDNQKKEIFNEF